MAEIVERSLAQNQPFGDCFYINNLTWERYKHRLKMLAPDLAVSTVMADVLQHATIQNKYKIIGDPVVRDAINSAVVHYKLNGSLQVPLDEIENILNIAVRHIVNRITRSPLEATDRGCLRISSAPDRAWVWSEERAEDLVGRYFRRMVETSLPMLVLQTPEDRPQKMLEKGTVLLEKLFPQLARSALSHVHVVAIVKHRPGFLSVSHPDVMGTIFLSPLVLQNPWQAAEFLLHEAMHQKFIDLEHTHSILKPGYYNSTSPTIRPLWNRPGIGKAYEWPFHRALTVMHVYTCLALFFDTVKHRMVDLEEEYGPLHGSNPTVLCRSSLDRAQYLRHWIKEHVDNLGYAGQKFIKWLGELLDLLDPLPPVPEWTAHLLLDRYMKEAEQVKECLAGDNATVSQSAFPVNVLKDTIGSEIAMASHILSISGGAPLELPEYIQKSQSADTLGDRFALTRDTIFRALADSAGRPHYYRTCTLERVRQCEEILEAMIERSSQRINTVLSADSKTRTNKN